MDERPIRQGGLRSNEINEVAVAINDAEPLARCIRSRLGSPISIALVVLLLVAMPFAELILILEDELHLSECWSSKE